MDSLANFECRTCLGRYDNKFQYVDWNESISDLNITYKDCLNTLLGFGADEQNIFSNYNIPSQLCLECCDKLTAAYIFVQKAQEAHETLRLQCIQQLQADFEWVPVNDKHSVDEEIATTCEDIESVNEATQEDSISTDYEEYDMLNNIDNNNELFAKPKLGKKKQQQPIYSSKSIKNHSLIEEKEVGKLLEKNEDKDVINAHLRNRLLCHMCPRMCNHPVELKRHILTHNANRERNFSCDQCDLKFHTESILKYHAKTHDSSRQRFQCDQCDKSFLNKGSLTIHKQCHTGKMIECLVCQKLFLRPKDLEVHCRTHSGEKPFPCEKCEKAFMLKSTLNIHMRRHEGYLYGCDICGKKYTFPSSLYDHRKTHTGLPLKCATCSQGFGKTSKIMRHIRGVHKIKDPEEINKLIIKVKIEKVYRGHKKNLNENIK